MLRCEGGGGGRQREEGRGTREEEGILREQDETFAVPLVALTITWNITKPCLYSNLSIFTIPAHDMQKKIMEHQKKKQMSRAT